MAKSLSLYFLTFLFLLAYVTLVVTIGTDWLPDYWYVHLLYYPFVGLVWIYPIAKLMFWMKRKREESEQ
ncbi:DUF2842 domain-containing protein [Kiloniella laminariae]|uniref:DUF2842 domain-containing protein n=1 Tax=Kiloniella laminariae TaxID=454162 RepID=UPI0012FBD648